MAIKEDLEIAKEEVAALQAKYDEFIKRENPFKVGFDLAMYRGGARSATSENILKALSAKSSNPEDFLALSNDGWEAGWAVSQDEYLYITASVWEGSEQGLDFSKESIKEFNELEATLCSNNISFLEEYLQEHSDNRFSVDDGIIAERVCSYLVALFDDPIIEDEDSTQEEIGPEVLAKTQDSLTPKEKIEKEKKAAFRIGFDFGLKFGIVSGSSGECKYDIAAIGHEFAKKSPHPAGFADAFQEGFIAGKRCPSSYIRHFSGEGNVKVDDKYSEFIKLVFNYGVNLQKYYSEYEEDAYHYSTEGVDLDQVNYSVMYHLLSLFRIENDDSSLKVTPVIPSGEWTTCDSPTKAILDNPETLERFTEAWNNLPE